MKIVLQISIGNQKCSKIELKKSQLVETKNQSSFLDDLIPADKCVIASPLQSCYEGKFFPLEGKSFLSKKSLVTTNH